MDREERAGNENFTVGTVAGRAHTTLTYVRKEVSAMDDPIDVWTEIISNAWLAWLFLERLLSGSKCRV
jgi:hypothetical protein